MRPLVVRLESVDGSAPKRARHKRALWLRVIPLVLLILVEGSRWLLESADPRYAFTLTSEAAGCVLAGTILLFWQWASTRRKERGGGSVGSAIMGAFGVMLLVSAPAFGAVVNGRFFAARDAALALALTPVVAAVLLRALDNDQPGELTAMLWPGLAGVGGLLLLLPEPALGTARAWAGLAALPVLMGTGAVLAWRRGVASHRGEAPVGGWWFAVPGLLLSGASLFLLSRYGPLAGALHTTPTVGSLCADALIVGLSLVALVWLEPMAWSAQFLLVPLLAMLESVAFLRPYVDGRSWLGLALLAMGAVRLLLLKPEEPGPVSSLGVSSGRPSRP